MAAVGGSILEVTIKGRLFNVASDADANRDLGGYENDVQANGNKTSRILKTAKPWSLENIVLEIDDDRGDQEFLQEIADGTVFVPCSVTFASQLTYSGSGIVVDPIMASSANATATIGLKGEGELSKQ